MAIHRLRFMVATIVASLFLGTAGLDISQAADGPNQVSQSDAEMGNFVDSIFEPELRRKSPPRKRSKAPRRRPTQRSSNLRAKLVYNPDTIDGSPPYALVDRYGGVLRYIEPVDSIDLESYLGATVAVRRDTGDILLASQLALPRSSKRSQDLQLTAFQEPTPADAPEAIDAGEVVEESGNEDLMPVPEEEGPVYYDEGYHDGGYGGEYEEYYDDGLDFGVGCTDCGSSVCRRRGGCAPGARGVIFARAEYLAWWFDPMYTPPLAIRGIGLPVGYDPDGAGPETPLQVPAFQQTSVSFGGDVLDGQRDGLRLRLGLWLDDCGQWAIQGDYIGFSDESLSFVDGSFDPNIFVVGNDGMVTPVVGRPFIDATTGLDSVEDVLYPNLLGTVSVNITSEFNSAGLHLRRNLCCVDSCGAGCGDGVGCGSRIGCGSRVGGCGSGCFLGGWGTRRIDLLGGVRIANLNESLRIREQLEAVDSDIDGFPIDNALLDTTFDLRDNFVTENEFVGGEIGFLAEWERKRWSLELLSQIAIGNTQQRVSISGSTLIDEGLPTQRTLDGGLLTQDGTNIGNYSRSAFSVIPQIKTTLGYQVTPRLRATVGYTLFYWSRVVRPGDQIDLLVNTDALGEDEGDLDPARPAFVFRDTDLWAHGLNVGGEYRW